MDVKRRHILTTGLGAGALIASQSAVSKAAAGRRPKAPGPEHLDTEPLIPSKDRDQTRKLQQAIDRHAIAGTPLRLPPGDFLCRQLTLRPGSALICVPSKTRLYLHGNDAALHAHAADGCRLEGLTVSGKRLRTLRTKSDALISLSLSTNIVIEDCTLEDSPADGLKLDACSGRIQNSHFRRLGRAAIFSEDAQGLLISHNTIADCADNGILAWRREKGEDGTIIEANRIVRISAASGGSGQNGNGINVFRAGNVLVSANRITDCAYSAVRANAASNLTVTSNSCSRIGEVTIYAEFGFEGAAISNNIVEEAASGISVTNFNEGGRLAVVTGNLIRNLKRREFEPVDKRGEGISVEADTLVASNVIEGAPTCGLRIGWGTYRRDVIAAQNIVRNSNIGILISARKGQGTCAITSNLISGAKRGAIKLDDYGTPRSGELIDGTKAFPWLSLSQNVIS